MSQTQFIAQILMHTPTWVWGLLAVITLLGLRQARDQVLTTRRLLGMAIGWMAYSLWSAADTFGFHAPVLLAWAAGLALSVVAQHWLVAPRGVRPLGDGRYAVAGSLWPLATIWTVFGVRYVTSVAMVLNPALKASLAFDLAVAALYGLLSGLFLGRALRVLRSNPAATPALAAA